ncbi:hypothetical protein SAMD00023353_1201200 [Rosellinia necatrix]|uniref:Uncharacterized protein n=1 Tax=Rosellinia necatrix TaxID=77044 RepID=A0A1S8A6P9_ROSNE|nr:hypothetical protein SAMD00023353_1201200 [Rosellinia necatrix]
MASTKHQRQKCGWNSRPNAPLPELAFESGLDFNSKKQLLVIRSCYWENRLRVVMQAL